MLSDRVLVPEATKRPSLSRRWTPTGFTSAAHAGKTHLTIDISSRSPWAKLDGNRRGTLGVHTNGRITFARPNCAAEAAHMLPHAVSSTLGKPRGNPACAPWLSCPDPSSFRVGGPLARLASSSADTFRSHRRPGKPPVRLFPRSRRRARRKRRNLDQSQHHGTRRGVLVAHDVNSCTIRCLRRIYS